ncbi:hypothetical protein [Bacillus sp. 165]|uniref:hypothetical protein n=1 Tax=Bacillus sp. 165 TaxID=1529117 RepID=UPI001AD9C6FF|nr:hypothetical protein [Bacillus sp. 165]MBO9131482.1 hypothetical protein [Bacillus sp. 165]
MKNWKQILTICTITGAFALVGWGTSNDMKETDSKMKESKMEEKKDMGRNSSPFFSREHRG